VTGRPSALTTAFLSDVRVDLAGVWAGSSILWEQRVQHVEDDVIPQTVRNGPLPGTGGTPLVLVPWLVALLTAGFVVLSRA
jgi:hypothetical protein